MIDIKMRAGYTALALVVAVVLAGCGPARPSAQAMEDAAAAHSPLVGQPAPDFTLTDQNGRPVTLTDVRGRWVVLYFYPQDDTPGCTCEATEFTYLLSRFRNMNATIYGISRDTPGSHRLFIAKYGFRLDLLSDLDGRAMAAYGAWVDASAGTHRYGRPIRSTVIIDPQGIVRYHWPEVIPQGHAQRVRQKLTELQAGAAG